KLHNENDEAMFDSVIVVTDRRVLDKQLQDAIYQLEHKTGFVEKIEKNSEQLAQAIKNKVKIIVTTLQKVPFSIDRVKDISTGTYAIIIEGAHSSQGGKSARAMTSLLSNQTLAEAMEEEQIAEEELKDAEERILEEIVRSGQQDNISFFA